MRTTINHALDLLASNADARTAEQHHELTRIIRRVQSDYLEIIENALSLLVQQRETECYDYLAAEREKLELTKDRIGRMISQEELWQIEYDRLAIEYLFTRARLVDEIRMFPDIALELLERMTLDQSISETITYLERAMTGKQNLFTALTSDSSDAL